jgi:very-short-patch-repair endonuclease
MNYNSIGHVILTIRLEVVDKSMERLTVDTDNLVQSYVSGESELSIANRFGISRSVVRRLLLKSGVQPRGQSEANIVSMSRMTPEQREARCASAHASARGRKQKLVEKVRRAQTRQNRLRGVSQIESALCTKLTDRGLQVVQQQAIGPYNCDIGAAPVAVEVFGGGWHWHGRHLKRAPERIRYLLDAGWHVLMVSVTSRHPVSDALADYIASYVEAARSNPTAVREYRVVRGAGELMASGSANDDEISIVPALGYRRDATSGRYQSGTR